MIHYQLQCSDAHAFDGWFKNSAAFEQQAASRLIECPKCGDTHIERALMAPAVAKRQMRPTPLPTGAPLGAPVGGPMPEPSPSAPGRALPEAGRQIARAEAPPDRVAATRLPAQMLAALQRIRAEVEKHCVYVGSSFAEEARKIHRGESAERPIYGETTEDQAEGLAEDGISVARIPWVPRADG